MTIKKKLENSSPQKVFRTIPKSKVGKTITTINMQKTSFLLLAFIFGLFVYNSKMRHA